MRDHDAMMIPPAALVYDPWRLAADIVSRGGKIPDYHPAIPLPIRLNLGAGNRRQREGYVTLDADPAMSPDIIATVPPIPLPDQSCETIFCSHMLEHLTRDDALALMAEVWRVLIVDGTIEFVVPYALSHGAFQDPDHKSYWVPEAFLYHSPHFAYLNRTYEQRFQMVSALTEQDVLRILMRKTATIEEMCDCPICVYGRQQMEEKEHGEAQGPTEEG